MGQGGEGQGRAGQDRTGQGDCLPAGVKKILTSSGETASCSL